METNTPAAPDEKATGATKAIVARYAELWNTGNVALADAIIAPDFADRSHPERTPGPAAVKEEVTEFRTAFPDARATIEQMVAEDDTVAFRFVLRGTHTAAFRGFPPSGATLTLTGMDFVRIVAGRFAELWSCQDALSWLHQLGVELRFPEQV